MSDITLTTGIRQNLLSLQQTSTDLTTTQEALATGKKVNSAADNPSSYFTSQSLTQTANSLAALLDQIGQGSSTIEQATNGLTSLTGLLQQALSTVQQAQSSNWTTAASSTGSANLASFTAGTTTGTTSVASPLTAADTLTISIGTSAISVALTSGETLSQVENAISTATGGKVTATDDGTGHLILKSTSGTPSFSVAADSTFGLAGGGVAGSFNTSAATTLAAGSLVIDVGSSTYTVSISASSSLAAIEADINSTTGLGANGIVSATDDGSGHLVLASNEPPIGFTVAANSYSAGLGVTTNATTNNVAIGSSSTRNTLQGNFNGLLTQINQLASDSGYNGINLLAGDSLTIDFNPTGTSSLTITGVTFNSAGLGLSAVTGSGSTSFQSDSQLASVIASINAAIATVQTQTETFGTNASTINTRQHFETALINTLQTGATNLVVADQNQESANLLTEQTQQQLEISALSIANQANQSVLKLFS
ncbi:MAG TPA: flagellin [Xanthobacteraceae bacterium]|jgi:flagellin|nr:flagellin [Xanthobacteraceae bacterium]